MILITTFLFGILVGALAGGFIAYVALGHRTGETVRTTLAALANDSHTTPRTSGRRVAHHPVYRTHPTLLPEGIR